MQFISMRLFAVCIVFWTSSCERLFCQDTLLLMNGRELVCKHLSDSGLVMYFDIPKRSGKSRIVRFHRNEVFSVRSGGIERLIYDQDPMSENFYSVDEMRFYMAGERDARENFHAWIPFGISVALCAPAGFLGEDGIVLSVFPPMVCALAHLIPKVRIRERYMSSTTYKYNDLYLEGFTPKAQSRRVSRALIGGYAGSALGVATWYLLGRP
jgi:hypothetical protein